MHSIDNAVDLQVEFIGKNIERSRDVEQQLEKQKREVTEKFEGYLETCKGGTEVGGSKQAEIQTFFESLREILNAREQVMLKELDEKVEGVTKVFTKKLEGLEEQEVAIHSLQSMMDVQ